MVVIKCRSGLALAAITLVTLAWSTPVLAQATTDHTDTTFPFSTIMEECTPEPVAVSGKLHIVTETTTDGADGMHQAFTLNSRRVFGLGLISGARYRMVNVSTSHFSETASDATIVTGTSEFKMIGQGPAANTTAFLEVHVTMNANGEVTADSSHAHGNCP